MHSKTISGLIATLIMLLVSTPSFAAWQYAKSYVYFDAQGTVVGQSIQNCSTAVPRKASGQVTDYWREDSVLCSNLVSYGTVCTYYDESPPPAGDVYPRGGWVCDTHGSVAEEGGKITTGYNHLPPGLSLENSCQKVGCDFREQWFISELQAGIYTDFSNASTPRNYP
jgi:hypothetical protein